MDNNSSIDKVAAPTKAFEDSTWEDVYTQTQKQQLIGCVTKILERILASPESKKLLQPTLIAAREEYDPYHLNDKYGELFISKDGFVEGRQFDMSMRPGDCKLIPLYKYIQVTADVFPSIIEKYKLNYRKLENFLNLIETRIV